MKAALILFASHFPKPLAIMLLSIVPVLEIRGALPVGVLLWHMPWYSALFFSVVGELLVGIPLFFGLDFARKILFRIWPTLGNRFDEWVAHIQTRAKDKYEKYGAWALFLLTAPPVPLTGIYSATIVAVLFKIPFKKAFAIITLGVCVSGMLVLGLIFAGYSISA